MNIANPEKKEEALNNEIEELDTKNNQIIEIVNENIELLNENTSKLIKYAQGLPSGAIGGSELSLSSTRDTTYDLKSHKLRFKRGKNSIFKVSENNSSSFDNPGQWSDEVIAELINNYSQAIYEKVSEAFPEKAEEKKLTPFEFKNFINITSPTFRRPFYWYVDNLDDFCEDFKNLLYSELNKSEDEDNDRLVLDALKKELE